MQTLFPPPERLPPDDPERPAKPGVLDDLGPPDPFMRKAVVILIVMGIAAMVVVPAEFWHLLSGLFILLGLISIPLLLLAGLIRIVALIAFPELREWREQQRRQGRQ